MIVPTDLDFPRKKCGDAEDQRVDTCVKIQRLDTKFSYNETGWTEQTMSGLC